MGKKNKCSKDSYCRILRRNIGNQIMIRTKSGDIISGELVSVTDGGIVEVLEPEMLSPFMSSRLTFIKIKRIEYFSVDQLELT